MLSFFHSFWKCNFLRRVGAFLALVTLFTFIIPKERMIFVLPSTAFGWTFLTFPTPVDWYPANFIFYIVLMIGTRCRISWVLWESPDASASLPQALVRNSSPWQPTSLGFLIGAFLGLYILAASLAPPPSRQYLVLAFLGRRCQCSYSVHLILSISFFQGEVWKFRMVDVGQSDFMHNRLLEDLLYSPLGNAIRASFIAKTLKI